MPLHFKRTPAEEEHHAHKKGKKAKRKDEERRKRHAHEDEDGAQRKRHRSRSRSPKRRRRKYYNEPPSPGDPGPSTSANRSTYDEKHQYDYYDDLEEEAARERLEKERFEEKMRDALEDDGLYDSTQRLDDLEARLNSYAHIPRRWRGTDEGFCAGLWMEDAREDIGLEPWQMNDDEYAEYIRAGMWRKKNQAEYEERLRRKEERRARKEREQRLREETRRLEREAQAEREMRVAATAKRRIEEARCRYEERWTSLLSRSTANAVAEDDTTLGFDDIPWPIYFKGSTKLDVEEFTKDAISSFLLHKEKANGGENTEPVSQSFKDILRTTMLRFHPDKFEARILSRVVEKDRELVKEAANAVVQFLNDLLKEYRE